MPASSWANTAIRARSQSAASWARSLAAVSAEELPGTLFTIVERFRQPENAVTECQNAVPSAGKCSGSVRFHGNIYFTVPRLFAGICVKFQRKSTNPEKIQNSSATAGCEWQK